MQNLCGIALVFLQFLTVTCFVTEWIIILFTSVFPNNCWQSASWQFQINFTSSHQSQKKKAKLTSLLCWEKLQLQVCSTFQNKSVAYTTDFYQEGDWEYIDVVFFAWDCKGLLWCDNIWATCLICLEILCWSLTDNMIMSPCVKLQSNKQSRFIAHHFRSCGLILNCFCSDTWHLGKLFSKICL